MHVQQRNAKSVSARRSPWRWLLLPFLLTRLIAERFIDCGWLVDYRSMSRWNYAFSAVALLACVWFWWLPSQGLPLWQVIIGYVLVWISVLRVTELVIAFYRDGIQRLGTVEGRTELTSSERIWLLIRAYLEIIVQFAIIDYWISYVRGAKAFKQPLCSIWDSLYFSGMTITTTGYGDFAPVDPFARASALIEAISGVFFIALSLAAYLSANRVSDTGGEASSPG